MRGTVDRVHGCGGAARRALGKGVFFAPQRGGCEVRTDARALRLAGEHFKGLLERRDFKENLVRSAHFFEQLHEDQVGAGEHAEGTESRSSHENAQRHETFGGKSRF